MHSVTSGHDVGGQVLGAGRPAVAAAARTFCVYFLSQWLRSACYLSTPLPGSGPHCLGALPPPPERWVDGLFAVRSQEHCCGDLMFSGHMATALTACCCLSKYFQNCFGLSDLQNRWARAVWWLLAALEAVLIVVSRQHYTVDVVVSLYTTPLVWAYSEHVWPDDIVPVRNGATSTSLDLKVKAMLGALVALSYHAATSMHWNGAHAASG